MGLFFSVEGSFFGFVFFSRASFGEVFSFVFFFVKWAYGVFIFEGFVGYGVEGVVVRFFLGDVR